MSIYPARITEIIERRSRDKIRGNGNGRAASFECGSFVGFSISIDAATKRIDAVRSASNGCGYMAAAAQSLAEIFEGQNLRDLHGVNPEALASEISGVLGELPESRRQCIDTAIESFRDAIADHRRRFVEEFSGETALICSCFGISEDRIIEVINETNAETTEDVASVCNAGTGCGSCRILIQELVDAHHAE